MASGSSAYGNTGPCYRFWLAFKNCRLVADVPAVCTLEQADYMECLHRKTLKRRIADKAIELQRQTDVASGKAPADGGHH